MSNLQPKLEWEKEALRKFDDMIERIPLFHRKIAKEVAFKKAEFNAKARSSNLVEENDIIGAFITEVPTAFYSLMIRLFQQVGFDYKKYEASNRKKD